MTKTLKIDLEYLARTYGLDVLMTAAIIKDKGGRKLVLSGEKEGKS